MSSVRESIRNAVRSAQHWTEIRYHNRNTRVFGVRKGEVQEMTSRQYAGCGIRVLINGTMGFSSTSDLSPDGVLNALVRAQQMALELSSRKKERTHLAETDRLAKGEFFLKGFDELWEMPIGDKFEAVRRNEQAIAKSSAKIETASCRYTEVFEEKIVVTSDGADVHSRLVRPEMSFVAIAADGAKKASGKDAVGATGAWECLFLNRSNEKFIESAVSSAVTLLKAPPAKGGRKKVILSPGMVGLLCHEAIGHTVEADFVLAGSVAQGKIGQFVASPLVNLCDAGISDFKDGAGGTLPVDDEGVLTEKTYIIKGGQLASYLHNRESAHHFGVEPTGNARAWTYSDEPLIRMRNTYIEPGKDKLSKMIEGIDEGYFIDGAGGGQADSTGEFMFGADRVREIKNGKLGEYVGKVAVSGKAFEVLATVDAVSEDFQWDLGSGHCGKGQPAKVDAGGPYVRCELLVGGAQ